MKYGNTNRKHNTIYNCPWKTSHNDTNIMAKLGNILFNTMTLSDDGIISALYIEKEMARVVWYRTDSLIAAILEK